MSSIDPQTYSKVVIAKALDIYDRTGMKVNRLYTPMRMLRAAETITGKKYKRGQYALAASDIRATLEEAPHDRSFSEAHTD